MTKFFLRWKDTICVSWLPVCGSWLHVCVNWLPVCVRWLPVCASWLHFGDSWLLSRHLTISDMDFFVISMLLCTWNNPYFLGSSEGLVNCPANMVQQYSFLHMLWLFLTSKKHTQIYKFRQSETFLFFDILQFRWLF